MGNSPQGWVRSGFSQGFSYAYAVWSFLLRCCINLHRALTNDRRVNDFETWWVLFIQTPFIKSMLKHNYITHNHGNISCEASLESREGAKIGPYSGLDDHYHDGNGLEDSLWGQYGVDTVRSHRIQTMSFRYDTK